MTFLLTHQIPCDYIQMTAAASAAKAVGRHALARAIIRERKPVADQLRKMKGITEYHVTSDPFCPERQTSYEQWQVYVLGGRIHTRRMNGADSPSLQREDEKVEMVRLPAVTCEVCAPLDREWVRLSNQGELVLT